MLPRPTKAQEFAQDLINKIYDFIPRCENALARNDINLYPTLLNEVEDLIDKAHQNGEVCTARQREFNPNVSFQRLQNILVQHKEKLEFLKPKHAPRNRF